MGEEGLRRDELHVELSRQLRLIANDLRVNGDIQMRVLSEHGVSDSAITLADELWLIALRLDPAHAFDQPYEPDGALKESEG